MASGTDNTELIEQLMQARFCSGSGTRRSAAYQYGTRSIFESRLNRVRLGNVPYIIGTAEADAYFAGQQDGHALVAAYLTESAQVAKAALAVPA